MTDEAYTLMQTNRERAIVKRSAANKVSGSKTHYAGSFGVEGKSAKQLAAMNGPVMSMDPKKFYTWKEFKALAPNLQIEYLEKLVYHYNIGLKSIAQEQFGLTNSSALMKHMVRHVDPNYKSPNKLGFRSSKAGREKYLNDMAEAWCQKPAEESTNETAETTIETKISTIDTMIVPATTTMPYMNIRTIGMDMHMLTQLCEMFKDYPNVPVNIIIGGESSNN